MSVKKKPNPFLALAAAIIGVASVPVTAFVSLAAGLVMMALPLWMIYKAS